MTTRARLLASAGLVLALVVLGASPAGAVTPRPTNDHSQVTSVDPAGVVAARVIGGDSLLEVTAAVGHEVVVAGYGGEPYLRIQPDGSVQVNGHSAAVSLNRSRAGAPVALSAPAPTDVDWQPFGSGGTVTWHDHRIHAGDGVDLSAPIDWTIPITVDGSAGFITGRLERQAAPSPLPALAGALVLTALIYAAGRRHPVGTSIAALAVAAVVAAGTGFVEWHSLPATTARNAGLFLLPLAAAAGAAVALVTRRQMVRLVALVLSVSLLAGWLAFRWSILTRAVLVSDLAPTVDRAGMVVVLGSALAAAGLIVNGAGSEEAQVGRSDRSGQVGPG